jgi:type III secretion protein V
MSTYAILSVGDGLISQIPALLISITAGIIVTRVPGDKHQNLAAELTAQISRHPQALYLSAAVLLLFALLPGFPAIYFFVLAAMMLGYTWHLRMRGRQATCKNESIDRANSNVGEAMIPGATPLMVRYGESALRPAKLAGAIAALRAQKFEDLGLPLPDIHLRPGTELAANSVQILLYQTPVLTITVPHDEWLIDTHATPVPQNVRSEPLPFGKLKLNWIDSIQASAVNELGVPIHRDEERITHCLSLVIDQYASHFVGVQEARYLMDAMEDRYAELVQEVQRQIPIGRIADVLQRLVDEGISVRDLRGIFEALVEWAPREKDPLMLAEYVRVALRRQITTRHRGRQPWISCWMIGERIESMVRESIRQTAAGSYSSLHPEHAQAIVERLKMALEDADLRRTVLVTAIDVRRFVRKIIEHEFGNLPVLSFQELSDEVELRVIGTADLIEELADAAT